MKLDEEEIRTWRAVILITTFLVGVIVFLTTHSEKSDKKYSPNFRAFRTEVSVLTPDGSRLLGRNVWLWSKPGRGVGNSRTVVKAPNPSNALVLDEIKTDGIKWFNVSIKDSSGVIKQGWVPEKFVKNDVR